MRTQRGSMLEFVYALFFGCFHQRTTFPMTVLRSSPDGEIHPRTYVTCLSCGEELSYNWNNMKIEGRVTRDVNVPVPVRPTAVDAGSGRQAPI